MYYVWVVNDLFLDGPTVVEPEFGPPDTLPLGAMGTPSEFDRRKKKKLVSLLA